MRGDGLPTGMCSNHPGMLSRFSRVQFFVTHGLWPPQAPLFQARMLEWVATGIFLTQGGT